MENKDKVWKKIEGSLDTCFFVFVFVFVCFQAINKHLIRVCQSMEIFSQNVITKSNFMLCEFKNFYRAGNKSLFFCYLLL